MTPTSDPKISTVSDELIMRLLRDVDYMTTAEKMTDSQLSDAAIDAFVGLKGLDYWVLQEMGKRFDKHAGIRRDEETGEIVTS